MDMGNGINLFTPKNLDKVLAKKKRKRNLAKGMSITSNISANMWYQVWGIGINTISYEHPKNIHISGLLSLSTENVASGRML